MEKFFDALIIKKLACSSQVCMNAILIFILFYVFQLPTTVIVCSVVALFFIGPDKGRVRNVPVFIFFGFITGLIIGWLLLSHYGSMPGIAIFTILIWVGTLSYLGDCFPSLKMPFNFIAIFPLVMLAAAAAELPQFISLFSGILLSLAILGTAIFMLIQRTLFPHASLPIKIQWMRWQEIFRTLRVFNPRAFFVVVNKILAISILFLLQAIFSWTGTTLFIIAVATVAIVMGFDDLETRGAIIKRAGGALLGASYGALCTLILSYFPFVWLMLIIILVTLAVAAYHAQKNLLIYGITLQFALAFFITFNPIMVLAGDIKGGLLRAFGILLGCSVAWIISQTLRWQPLVEWIISSKLTRET